MLRELGAPASAPDEPLGHRSWSALKRTGSFGSAHGERRPSDEAVPSEAATGDVEKARGLGAFRLAVEWRQIFDNGLGEQLRRGARILL